MNISHENSSPPSSQKPKNSFPFGIIIIVLVFAYAIFLMYQSVYFNYKTNRKIQQLKDELKTLDKEKRQLESIIAYYKTEDFQELEARKKLGFKMPGENMITVEVEKEASPEPAKEETNDNTPTLPNWQKWLDYLMGRPE